MGRDVDSTRIVLNEKCVLLGIVEGNRCPQMNWIFLCRLFRRQTVDLGHNARVHALALYVDAIAPTISFTTPLDGALLNVVRPAFTLNYGDVGSGVNPATLAFHRGTSVIAMSCSTTASGATCTPVVAFPQGPSTVTAVVADRRGNISSAATVHIFIDSIPPVTTTMGARWRCHRS